MSPERLAVESRSLRVASSALADVFCVAPGTGSCVTSKGCASSLGLAALDGVGGVLNSVDDRDRSNADMACRLRSTQTASGRATRGDGGRASGRRKGAKATRNARLHARGARARGRGGCEIAGWLPTGVRSPSSVF